jgi:two-component system phosphate regulon sensor histidine kinase PhoR
VLRSRFLWKLYAGYVTVIFLTTAIVGIMVERWIEEDSLEETKEALRANAVLLRELALPFLLGPVDPGLQKKAAELATLIGSRLTVIRADGTVVADSEEGPQNMDNHSTRPEITAACASGIGMATRYSQTVGVRMMYLALPAAVGGEICGFVRAALPLESVDSRLSHLRRTVAVGAGIAAAAALLLGYVVTRRVTRPLVTMTAVAESIAAGNYDQKVESRSKDEIGKLSRAFNRMAEQLTERMKTITRDRNKVLTILSSMVEGVVAVDHNERVIHMNAAAGQMLKANPQDSLGRRFLEVTQVEKVSETLSATLREAADHCGEIRLVGDSSDQVIELHSSPLRDGSGSLFGAVIILHDVTQVRRLEAVRRDFVANVSHELKTPLTAIRGLVETLCEEEGVDPGTQKRFLRKIRDQAARLSTLVADLLTLSRVESQGDALERQLLDLREIARSSAQRAQAMGEKKGLKFELVLPEQSMSIVGDEEALQQVLDNLLDNAVKYTPGGGRVWLRLRLEGEHVVAEVEDTGIGLEPQHLERIFERFYRVDKARSRELGGTGLGLSIVKHFVATLGGKVSVESTPGKGSTFRVRLPLVTGAA